MTPHFHNPRNVATICERTFPKGENKDTNKMNDDKSEPEDLIIWTPYEYRREWSKLNMTGHDSSDESSSDDFSSDGYDSDETDDFSTDDELTPDNEEAETFKELTSDNEEAETFEEPEEPDSDNYDADDMFRVVYCLRSSA